jgi:hypothetical protein
MGIDGLIFSTQFLDMLFAILRTLLMLMLMLMFIYYRYRSAHCIRTTYLTTNVAYISFFCTVTY